MLLDHMKSEQQDLRAVSEAYDKLHQQHAELTSQAKVQAQHVHEPEMQAQTSTQVHSPIEM